MKARWAIAGLAMVLAWSGVAHGKVDLSKLDKGMAGPRTQVLVLGSVHLSQLPRDFSPKSLKPLLARLAAFRPDIITIEAVSGESCNLMAHYPTIYSPAELAPYCLSTEDARIATGLDVPSAIAQVHRILSDWPPHPTPANAGISPRYSWRPVTTPPQ